MSVRPNFNVGMEALLCYDGARLHKGVKRQRGYCPRQECGDRALAGEVASNSRSQGKVVKVLETHLCPMASTDCSPSGP